MTGKLHWYVSIDVIWVNSKDGQCGGLKIQRCVVRVPLHPRIRRDVKFLITDYIGRAAQMVDGLRTVNSAH